MAFGTMVGACLEAKKLCPFVLFPDITMSEFLKNCIILVELFLLADLNK
jgi:hypothetical protein